MTDRGTHRVKSSSEHETQSLGEWFGSRARAGTVLELRGPLGAGKTRFVRGLAMGLGIDRGIRSPTFTICHRHEGREVLYHLDAYRVEDPSELLLQGWDDMCSTGIVAVEWGERLAPILPDDRLVLTFAHESPSVRRITVEPQGPTSQALVEVFMRSRTERSS